MFVKDDVTFWLCSVTFGGWSAHLAYHVHKGGHKTSIIICDHLACLHHIAYPLVPGMVILGLLVNYHMGDASALVLIWLPISVDVLNIYTVTPKPWVPNYISILQIYSDHRGKQHRHGGSIQTILIYHWSCTDSCMLGSHTSWKTWKITNSFSRSWKCPGILQNQKMSWKKFN